MNPSSGTDAHRPVALLVPHAGAMCLLERVVSCDATEIVCATRSHRSPDNPLRAHGSLAAVHVAEYGAQAMAAHGALAAGGPAGEVRGGRLVSIRDLALHVDRLDTLDGELLVRARRLVADSHSQIYDFTAWTESGVAVATGRVAVMLERAGSDALVPRQ